MPLRTHSRGALALLAAAVPLFAQSPPQSPRVVPYPIDLPPAFQRAMEAGTRTANGRPGPKYWTNHASYRIEAELDPATARLTGRATMTYHNRSPRPIDRLVVHCYQDLMKPEAQRTRSNLTPTAGLEVAEVRIAGKPVKASTRETKMTIPLATGLAPDARIDVEIDYAFTIPAAGKAPRMGHETDKVFYLGYWYPQFAVFDDVDGWVADPHRGNGEFYMDYADYELAITAPQGYLVQATGELQNADDVLLPKARQALAAARTSHDVVHVIDKTDHEAGLVTATSANGKLVWRFRATNVRDAAVSIARSYVWDATHAVVKDKDGPGKDGTTMIHALYEPESTGWTRAARYVQHTIEYMSAHVYPYPWPHMSACEGIIGGGMEYPMMTLCGPRAASTTRHETIHMWFPMIVGSNEKRYAWQDEGFTSFWTTLCGDDFDGKKNGPVRDVMSYANTVKNGGDVVCMRHADTYGGDDFAFASYTKTAAIMHQLRALLGDETFFAAFRRYVNDWAMKHPAPFDVFATFQDVAGTDLQWYFRTWFFEAWRLDHAIASVTDVDGHTRVVVEDRGRAVHPAVVEATFPDGKKERQTVAVATWWNGTRATLDFSAGAAEIAIDPDFTSLDCVRDDNKWRRTP